MNNNIMFTKVRDVKSPSQAYSYPAGTDFYVPSYSKQFVDDIMAKNPNTGDYELSITPSLDSVTITIMPSGRINIPSGIRVDMSNKDTCLLAANKSGVSSKKGLNHLAELVDADYKGEIHINLYNTGDAPVSIKSGDKVIQFVNLPVIYPVWNEVTNSEFDSLSDKTDRGSSGFGSSGV